MDAMAQPRSAATRVLLLPELLEQILVYSYTFHATSLVAKPSLHLLRLRSVSIVWQSIINNSPTLQTLTFRHPRLCATEPHTDIAAGSARKWQINRSFQCWLMENMRVNSMTGEGLNSTQNRKSFERFAEKACSNSVGGLPWMYLTQPAVTSVSMYFGLVFTQNSLQDEWKAYKVSFNSNRNIRWRSNRLILNNNDGITTRFVLETVIDAIKALYSLKGSGNWLLHEISMMFGVGKEEDFGENLQGNADENVEDDSDLECEAEYIFWPLRSDYGAVLETLDQE
ncbi:hypothetical protein TWF718_003406 [Orbilia javanica]|uniref:Uncharacterized protein n=1 Tax=Orbilia javanica TaxID=47235 RepID=A0AAN8NKP4_9PEZI